MNWFRLFMTLGWMGRLSIVLKISFWIVFIITTLIAPNTLLLAAFFIVPMLLPMLVNVTFWLVLIFALVAVKKNHTGGLT